MEEKAKPSPKNGERIFLGVAPRNLYLVQENQFICLIQRNTPLPVLVEFIMATKSDNQKYLKFEIRQGSEPVMNRTKVFGIIRIEIPEGRQKGSQIRVKMELDEDRTNIEAFLVVTGEKLKIE